MYINPNIIEINGVRPIESSQKTVKKSKKGERDRQSPYPHVGYIEIARKPGDDNNEEGLQQDTKTIVSFIKGLYERLDFVLYKAIDGQMMLKIIDKESRQVLKEYAPEHMLPLMAKIKETIAGVLIDEEA